MALEGIIAGIKSALTLDEEAKKNADIDELFARGRQIFRDIKVNSIEAKKIYQEITATGFTEWQNEQLHEMHLKLRNQQVRELRGIFQEMKSEVHRLRQRGISAEFCKKAAETLEEAKEDGQ